MRFVNTLPLLLGLSGMLAGIPAWALPADREQPIRVQADSAELDDAKHVAVYRGDVVVTQGSLKITGDTVTVTQDKNGEIDTLTSVGRPAYYEQRPSPDKQLVKAYGLTIQYFAANERIVLIDQAKVIQDGNTFEGEKIVYDTQRQIVNAGRANGSKVTTPRTRIDMTLLPRSKKAPLEPSNQ